jgi:outer membrane protein assembly factor BamB
MWRLVVWLAPALLTTTVGAADTSANNWPQFRGTQASGVGRGTTPEKWSAPKWKTPIPGLAHSCPAIWGDRIFITTAVSDKGEQQLKIGLYGSIEPVEEDARYSWQVFCLDKREGKIRWRKTAHEGIPKIKRHPKSSHANCTPATDGKHLVCFFGAEGLFCYDLEGKLLWQKDFSSLDSGYYVKRDAQWGFASSPVIHENMVIVACDVQTNSFLAALDIKDGRELWRTPRNDVPTWSTPTVDVRPGRAQVIVNGYHHIGGYDLRTGKELWKMGEGGDIPVPTPILAHDLVFVTSAHGRLSPIYAIRPNATGDVSLQSGAQTNQFVAWSVLRGGNYMQTPIALGDYLYCGRDHGVVTCFTATTGQQHYSERLGPGRSGFTASPVAADNKLYFTSEEGKVYVLKAGPKFELLATNDLGEPCMATPAISEGALYFRAQRHLICVADGKDR